MTRNLPYVTESFAILGGTSTNCAGGETPWGSWLTCEEVVKRTADGREHGYVFEVDAFADGPVPALRPRKWGASRTRPSPTTAESSTWRRTDRSAPGQRADGSPGRDPRLGVLPLRSRAPDRALGHPRGSAGKLQGLKLRDEPRANMDAGRVPGRPYAVEWVDVPECDHEDDSDNRRDRVPGFTPTRIQAIDRGAAIFGREEGCWVGHGKVYFDCTSGGAASAGQIWEYDPGRETLTLIFESDFQARLDAPDNIVIVPSTGDIFAQEDGGGNQFIRGITRGGSIYDFARTGANNSEFCGGCFDPNGQILYVNQQGGRSNLPEGPADDQAITYAIFGPFEKRDGSRGTGGHANGSSQ